jgi:hypothetical protein
MSNLQGNVIPVIKGSGSHLGKDNSQHQVLN